MFESAADDAAGDRDGVMTTAEVELTRSARDNVDVGEADGVLFALGSVPLDIEFRGDVWGGDVVVVEEGGWVDVVEELGRPISIGPTEFVVLVTTSSEIRRQSIHNCAPRLVITSVCSPDGSWPESKNVCP